METEFVPARLTTARQRRRLRANELAAAAGITAGALSLYERGKRQPPADVVTKLAEQLGVKPGYFGRKAPELLSLDNASFRALTSMSARDRDAALALAAIAHDITAAVAERFDLPPVDLPELHTVDPELAATTLRMHWGLDDGPMPNLVHLAEASGVRVFSLPTDTAEEINAFATWLDGTPYMFLATTKSPERRRFDAAHELGHLVMHRREKPHGRAAENEANAFGAALMMPSSSFRAAAPSHFFLDDVPELKAAWGVSASAYVKRLHTVGLISDWQYRDAFIEMTVRGWRLAEPEPRLAEGETSRVLQNTVQWLWSHREVRPFVDEIGLPLQDVNGLVFGFLPEVLRGEGLAGGEPVVRDLAEVPRRS